MAQSGDWGGNSKSPEKPSPIGDTQQRADQVGKSRMRDAGAMAPDSGTAQKTKVGAGFPDTGSSPNANGLSDGDSGKGKKRRRRKRRRSRRGGLGSIAPNMANSDISVAGEQPSAATAEAANGKHHHPKPKDPLRHNARSHRPAGQSANPQHASQNAYAALDLGTNNCRLLVAVPTRPGTFRVIDAFSRIVRLGEGLGASGRLSQAAMDRAIEALKVCRDKLYSRPIQRARLIATEACRSADNGAEFLDRVFEQTGLKLEVVDRETEARLAVSGCASLVDRAAKAVVLFDIGGGSSEIALVNAENYRGGRLADHIHAWTSLPVGVVTMAEKFGGRDVSKHKFNDMIDHATELLQNHSDLTLLGSMSGGDASVTGDDFHLIGTSGTVTTLAGIHLDLPRYDRRQVDGLWMSATQVDNINNQLLDWSFEERAANACIGNDRADLVLAGCAILEAIRKVWPSDRLRVADRGLREGLLTEMMATDGVWRRRNRKNFRHRNRNGNEGPQRT